MGIYAVTGASGNTGAVCAQALLEKGHKVRVIGRSAEKLQALVDKGAEAFVGDLSDAAFLTRAFTGVDGVYAMIPPNFAAPDFRAYQNQITAALKSAIQSSGVKYVVTLSSVGAHLPEKAGVVQGLYDMEKSLDELPNVHILHLRAGYFMENLYYQVGSIKQMGVVAAMVNPDLQFPAVATQDIGRVAAERLAAKDFSGKTHEYVLGPRDLSYGEVTAIIGTAIGKSDLGFYHAAPEEVLAGMTQMGLSRSVAEAMVEFQKSMNAGLVTAAHTRTDKNSTPTTVETFVQGVAYAIQN